MRKIIVDENNQNQRIDKFLLKFMEKMPKSFLYKMLRKKNIKLNGTKVEGTEIINEGDEIDIFMTDETMINFGANPETLSLFDDTKVVENKKTIIEKLEKINQKEGNLKMRRPNLNVVYEDKDLLIVNKPDNMLVHPDECEMQEETLLSEIINYLDYKKDPSYLASKAMNFRPAICNRLDRNTTGLVIACKTFAKTKRINQMIANGEIEKRYLCVVCGKMEKDSEELVNYYEKDEDNNEATIYDDETENSKEVKLRYKTLKKGFTTSLLEVELITGKSHQIRAQLAHIGHPLVGDRKYGDPDINAKFETQMKVKNQLLCAYKLTIGKDTYEIDCDFDEYVR